MTQIPASEPCINVRPLGRKPGQYSIYADCITTDGSRLHKKCETMEEAREWLRENKRVSVKGRPRHDKPEGVAKADPAVWETKKPNKKKCTFCKSDAVIHLESRPTGPEGRIQEWPICRWCQLWIEGFIPQAPVLAFTKREKIELNSFVENSEISEFALSAE
jgi:hypothetical protein